MSSRSLPNNKSRQRTKFHDFPAQSSNFSLFILFIDYEKAYDNVNRDKLWEMMDNKIPNYLLNTIKCIYRNTTVRIKFNDGIPAGEQPAAAHLLRSWVRIPPEAWIFVCCECRVLSGRGLSDELITRPEESYRLCCVVVCDLETSRMGAPYIYIYMTLVA